MWRLVFETRITIKNAKKLLILYCTVTRCDTPFNGTYYWLLYNDYASGIGTDIGMMVSISVQHFGIRNNLTNFITHYQT